MYKKIKQIKVEPSIVFYLLKTYFCLLMKAWKIIYWKKSTVMLIINFEGSVIFNFVCLIC